MLSFIAQAPKKVYERLKFDAPPITTLDGSEGSVTSLLLVYLKWFYTVFWIVAVGFLIWAAFTFLTASGEESKITEARKRVQYGVIAATVALLSTGIDIIVTSLLGGN